MQCTLSRIGKWFRSSVQVTVLYSKRCESSTKNSSPLRQLLTESSTFGEGRYAGGELQWATQPYASLPIDEDRNMQLDPREATILLFPGQGAQFIGMGRRLLPVPTAKDLYDLASSVVGWDVAKVCIEGPDTLLDERCQTCLFVTSLAALELVREERPSALERVKAVAGFSLGEITALTYAGALEFEEALRLVELRTAAMQAAAKCRSGGMLTVWLAPEAHMPRILEAAREHTKLPDAVCQVAIYLYPNCKVIAGDEEALRWVERAAGARGEWGVRRSARVRVCGALHTPLMARARELVREALASARVQAPRLPVLSAVDARPYRDAAHVRSQLARHVTAPVRWEQTLHALYARDAAVAQPLTLSLGPGRATRQSLRHVNARAWDASLHIDV